MEEYYRNAEKVRAVVDLIHRLSSGLERVKIMNFCGTHEWTVVHYGLRSLMPDNVELIAGPGCPVCITPSFAVEEVIRLSFEGVHVYTFGDAFRLPALRPVNGCRSLQEAKANGGLVDVVYSFHDAIKRKGHGEAVFFGIGFETTAPSYAIPLAKGMVPSGLYFLSVLRLTPPAANYALEKVGLVSGIIAPGHVSTITGAMPWRKIAEKYSMPVVISGFEPLDVLMSIAMILKMIKNGKAGFEIEYRRAVREEGNPIARNYMDRVFRVEDAAWRGIGIIPESGLGLKDERYDAYVRYSIKKPGKEEWRYDLPEGCKCAQITLGLAKPTDCPYYLKGCRPERPIGPCMVSSEGTCAIWARFGGGGLAERLAKDVGVA